MKSAAKLLCRSQRMLCVRGLGDCRTGKCDLNLRGVPLPPIEMRLRIRPLRARFENRLDGDSICGWVMIQALDVDRAEPWPDGQDRPEDQALPV